ncbi:MAG: hypothetical protein M0008_05725 [Actinomycetota bacterium]|nr:hypothetical protein [Actinomycetota bacterium]
MIGGHSATLSLPNQHTIARWIAKTTLIGLVKTADAGPLRDASTTLLRQVMSQLLPPRASCIRLFHTVPDDAPLDTTVNALAGGALPCPLSVFGVSYFGQFGYEMISGPEAVVLPYALRTRHNSFSVTVWPMSRTAVPWPPTAAVRGSDLLMLRDAHGSTRDEGVAAPFEYSWMLRQ